MSGNSQSAFAPANMSAGGFLDNVDCEIVGAKFGVHADTPFDPLGKDEEDSCYLIVSYLPDEADDDTPRDEYYRMAVVSKVIPSQDNTRAIFQDDAKLNKGTKAGLFFASLVNAGFPVSDLPADNSCKFLVGLHVHVDRVETEVKGGKKGGATSRFKAKPGEPEKNTFATVLVSKILEPKKGGKGPKPSATSSPAASSRSTTSTSATAASGDLQNLVVDILMARGELTKGKLPGEVMKWPGLDQAVKNAAFKVIGNDTWLTEGPWAYDQGAGTLTPNEKTAENMGARG